MLLCSTAVSHRLVADDSAPLPGAVFVGHDDEHQHYVANTYEHVSLAAPFLQAHFCINILINFELEAFVFVCLGTH